VLDRDKKTQSLLRLIKKHAIETRGKHEGPFKLSSGEESNYYYNMKKITLHPDGSNLIADIMLEKILEMQARSVGGLETGSVPISSVISSKSRDAGYRIPAFFLRKRRKEHGDEAEIEGIVKSPVVIVDDVTTKGESAMKAIRAIRAKRHEIVGVLTIVDREAGANRLFEEHGLELTPIFKHMDFKKYIDRQIIKKTKMAERMTESIAIQST
jgi:orotate phosphoribosyltransferase